LWNTGELRRIRAKEGPERPYGRHADIRTTLKIYTHFQEERAREAVGRIDGLLGAVPEPE